MRIGEMVKTIQGIGKIVQKDRDLHQLLIEFDGISGKYVGWFSCDEVEYREEYQNPLSVSETKQSNPKDAIGITKTPVSTIPTQVIGELGVAMLEGGLKYGRHNYREAGVRASVYYDAVVSRHLAAWWEGQDIDSASGLNHVTKAIAGLVVLRDSMLQENWVDDRPPKAKNQNWVEDLNVKTKALLEKYPDPVAPFTEIGKKGK